MTTAAVSLSITKLESIRPSLIQNDWQDNLIKTTHQTTINELE
jgi:hypothetical protein